MLVTRTPLVLPAYLPGSHSVSIVRSTYPHIGLVSGGWNCPGGRRFSLESARLPPVAFQSATDGTEDGPVLSRLNDSEIQTPLSLFSLPGLSRCPARQSTHYAPCHISHLLGWAVKAAGWPRLGSAGDQTASKSRFLNRGTPITGIPTLSPTTHDHT